MRRFERTLNKLHRESDARIASGRGSPTFLDASRLLHAGVRVGIIAKEERDIAGKLLCKAVLYHEDRRHSAPLTPEEHLGLKEILGKVGLG